MLKGVKAAPPFLTPPLQKGGQGGFDRGTVGDFGFSTTVCPFVRTLSGLTTAVYADLCIAYYGAIINAAYNGNLNYMLQTIPDLRCLCCKGVKRRGL